MRTKWLVVLAVLAAISCDPDDESEDCLAEDVQCPEGATPVAWAVEPSCQYTCVVSCEGIDYNGEPTTLEVDADEEDGQRDVCRFYLEGDVGYHQQYPTCSLPVPLEYSDPVVVEGPDYHSVIVPGTCSR